MNKTKVLCLFPRFYIGGVSKALGFVANTCDEAGMEVHCVSMTTEPETIILNNGIFRYHIDTEKGNSKVISLLCKIKFLICFRFLIMRLKPDVIVVFRPDLTKAVLYSLCGLSIPVISSERGNPLLYGNRLKTYFKVFSHCSAVVFQTEAAREVYNLSVKTAIIPNPAVSRNNTDRVKSIRRGPNIITVSRLSREKNIEGLLYAFALVKAQLVGRKLIIYGDGPQEDELRNLAIKLGIKDDVVFAGNVCDFANQDDNASIFVLNTLSEGMPNALIEAMLSGYACICTDCPIGAPRWLSDNERRVKLVPVKNNQELGNALLEVALDEGKSKQLAQNALEIRELLDPKRIGNLWLGLINEVLEDMKEKS